MMIRSAIECKIIKKLMLWLKVELSKTLHSQNITPVVLQKNIKKNIKKNKKSENKLSGEDIEFMKWFKKNPNKTYNDWLKKR